VRLVVVESPYAGDVERNLTYLRACLADCLARREAPFAAHALYTQPGVLDDGVPEQRRQGIHAGFAWAEKADVVVFYTDLGWSRGMLDAWERWLTSSLDVETRTLPGWK
jgi:hypothetical protein